MMVNAQEEDNMKKYIKPMMEEVDVCEVEMIATSYYIDIVDPEEGKKPADEYEDVLVKERDMHGLWERSSWNLWK